MKLFSAQRFATKLFVGFWVLLSVSNVFGAGEVDPTFHAGAYGYFQGNVRVFKKQPDGKILVGGDFDSMNGAAGSGIARLNADLTVDTSFNPPDFGTQSVVNAIGLQSDGKIILAGNLNIVDGVISRGLKRLLPNGTLDNTFQPPQVDPSFTYLDIDVLPDDKFIAFNLRHNADGTVDNSFTPIDSNVREVELQPDGKVIATWNNNLRRYNADGTPDATFTNVVLNFGSAEAIKYLPDGKILIGGNFTSINGFNTQRLSRLNSDGSVDFSFNTGMTGPNTTVRDINLRSDGKLVVAGDFALYNSVAARNIVLLNSDGSRDTSFQAAVFSGTGALTDVEIANDGRVIAGFASQNAFTSFFAFNTNGSIDTSLNLVASRDSSVNKIFRQPDGKYIIGGAFRHVNGVARKEIARLNADGTLDTSFAPDPTVFYSGGGMALQPDGKVLVGLKRLNSDGSIDETYNPTIIFFQVNEIVLQPDGKILLSGFNTMSSNNLILRFNSDGSSDPGFDTTTASLFDARIQDIELQPDGKILVGGAFNMRGSSVRPKIARLNADGTLDNTFVPPGGANGTVYAVKLQADGKIIIGGDFTGINGTLNQNKLARLNADATLDTSFAQNQSIGGAVSDLELQPDGKVIAVGSFANVGSTTRIAIARFNANGTLDPSLTTNFNLAATDVLLQPDGKIMVGGGFTRANGQSRVGIARLLNNIASRRAPFDFDGDGKTDIGVWRASSGSWWYLQSSDLSGYGFSFGTASDIITPGDYTGDGKTDLAVFRPSTAEWFIQRSEDSSYTAVPFGLPGDFPAPADYDGDGKTDLAVFRTSIQTWFIQQSGGGFGILTFGLDGDRPVPADYDGDGKADIAVWRPSNGSWWIVHSSDLSQHGYGFGLGTDRPVVGDYTGDGKADIAVWRPSTSEWYFLRSEDGSYYSYQSGLPGDIPAPGDYDGDGRFDSAVFRPSTQTWYIDGSTAGSMIATFGLNGDRPVANAFVP